MKAYILPSGVNIHPFGDPVSECYVGNMKLRDYQQKVLLHAGLEPVRIERPEQITEKEFFLTWDDVFFTRRIMDHFAKMASRQGQTLACALPANSLLVRRTRSLQDIKTVEDGGTRWSLYRFYYVRAERSPASQVELEQLLSSARPFAVRFKEKVLRVPAPKYIAGFSHYEHPVTSSILMHIRHWVHVLWANQLSIQTAWVEYILDHPLWSLAKLLSAGLTSLFLGRWSRAAFLDTLFGKANVIGPGARIHPTATVEGCLIGRNVNIGAYALVRGCLIGDNVTIEDRANVYFSVVGSDCFISKNSTMVFCAGFPDSDLCVNGIQACLFGSRCALTSRVWVIDLRATGQTRVWHEGRLQPIENKLLGACFGHGCWAGLDVTIAQGREIPNGAMLIRPPGDILRRIPADLPRGVPVWAENGTATWDRNAKDEERKS